MNIRVFKSSAAQRLLNHHRLRGRAYPKFTYWNRLYQRLLEEAEKRGKTPPPAPLEHGLEADPTEDDRIERLDEQVIWADRNTLLHVVKTFLDAIPASGWQMQKK
jgi:hypothetical protein